MRLGLPSKRFGRLGVHHVSLGSCAKEPSLRGDGLRVVIYDNSDNIVRELREEWALECGDILNFYEDSATPASYAHYLVDVAADGLKRTVHREPSQLSGNAQTWLRFLGSWAQRYGVPQRLSND